jgi:hypothetical protein
LRLGQEKPILPKTPNSTPVLEFLPPLLDLLLAAYLD